MSLKFYSFIFFSILIHGCGKKEEPFSSRSKAFADDEPYIVKEYKIDGVDLLSNSCDSLNLSDCILWRTDTTSGYNYYCFSDYFATNNYYLVSEGRNRMYFTPNHKFQFEWDYFQKVEAIHQNALCNQFYQNTPDYIKDFDYEIGYWELSDKKTVILTYEDGHNETFTLDKRNPTKLSGNINGRNIEIVFQ